MADDCETPCYATQEAEKKRFQKDSGRLGIVPCRARSFLCKKHFPAKINGKLEKNLILVAECLATLRSKKFQAPSIMSLLQNKKIALLLGLAAAPISYFGADTEATTISIFEEPVATFDISVYAGDKFLNRKIQILEVDLDQTVEELKRMIRKKLGIDDPQEEKLRKSGCDDAFKDTDLLENVVGVGTEGNRLDYVLPAGFKLPAVDVKTVFLRERVARGNPIHGVLSSVDEPNDRSNQADDESLQADIPRADDDGNLNAIQADPIPEDEGGRSISEQPGESDDRQSVTDDTHVSTQKREWGKMACVVVSGVAIVAVVAGIILVVVKFLANGEKMNPRARRGARK